MFGSWVDFPLEPLEFEGGFQHLNLGSRTLMRPGVKTFQGRVLITKPVRPYYWESFACEADLVEPSLRA